MTTIDAAVKDYKKALKDSDYTLKELEDRASEFAEMQDNRHDSESDFEDAQSELARVAADRDTTKEALSVAVLTGEGDVEELREQYASLTAEEDRLRERMDDAKAVEVNTPDPGEVAALKARLHNLKASGGEELLKAVKALVQEHSDSLRQRSKTAQELLPSVDSPC